MQKYDRFQDLTHISIQTDLPEAQASDTVVIHSAKLIIEHTCKSDVQQCPWENHLGVTFFFITKMWMFQNASVTLLVDGTRSPLTNVLHEGSVLGARQIMESVIAFPFPLATLRKIATAKTVEVKIGTTEFALSDTSLAAFRAISKTIKASPSAGAAPRKPPAK